MIRGVVLNQHCAAATITTGKLFQKCTVSGGIEDGVLGIVKAVCHRSMAPKILTFFRCPVTGTSGAQPTRLHVAWRVESCRKLASSVKISAQFCARAFF